MAGVLAALLAVGTPAAAEAQVRSTRVTEAAFGALWIGPMPHGERSADLTRPDGGALPLLGTTVSIGPGPGVEAHLARVLSDRVTVEATGTWISTEIRTRITSDFEDAPALTSSTSLTRLSVEGSALWTIATRGDRRTVFLRAGGGWMRELVGGAALAVDGAVGNVGAGVKYWWGTSIPGRGRRLGLRVDGRAVLRWRGVDLGTRIVRVAPAASANLMIGF